jgi:carboxyl-terminal processing protease
VTGGTNASSHSLASALTNSFHFEPGPEDGRVAFSTARMLEKYHYSHHHFDDSVSSKFLDLYLESLDPQHLHFLQSDLTEFEVYRTNLNRLTLTTDGKANTGPAFLIFSRFIERLQQQANYVNDLLQTNKFEFNSDEKITLNRHELPYPENLADAKKLWRQRLCYEYLQEKLALEDPDKSKPDAKRLDDKTMRQQIVDTLSHRYYRNLRYYTDWNHEDVLGFYLKALTHVYDPHSDYFTASEMDSFRMSMNLELFGIGAELRSDDGYCKIQRLLPGPAAKSKKIKEGDRIIAVAQSNQPPVDIIDMSINKAVQLIRGPKGTEVRLTIIPAADTAARTVVSLVRDEIPLADQAAKGRIIDLPESPGKTLRLGIIDLPSFYAPMELPTGGEAHSASADVAKLLEKFKREQVNGVILDLRRNGGGSLEEAVRLTGLFIKDGPVVQVAAMDGSLQVDRDNDSSITYDGPLIVLTSRLSASASEIVAGALQDYGRALIVGDSSTHGKGTVQNINPLRSLPGALKVTILKFYRASGGSTQLKGVIPDIVLPSVLNYWKDLGESALEYPMPWDKIAGVRFEKVNRVQPYLSELLRRSTERVGTNQDFTYVREDIDMYRKQEAENSASLNEKQRLQERQDIDNRQKARDKERLARKDPEPRIYEISLKQADLPGLPAPLQKTNTLVLNGKPDAWVLSTNSSTAMAPAAKPAQDDPDDLTPPSADVDLVEAEHIMSDYISLLPKNGMFTTAQSTP